MASLTLEGLEIACNGIIDWQLESIAYSESPFTRLKIFRAEAFQYLGEPCSAGTLRGKDPFDTSVATRLLQQMPVLEELRIPEPPRQAEFFSGCSHPLKRLSVFDIDYESFLPRFATCRRFGQLKQVVFRESCRTDVNPRLPFSQYRSWFESDAFPNLRSVKLAEADLNESDLDRLRDTRIGRELTELEVQPVRSWCDRPILYAPRDHGD